MYRKTFTLTDAHIKERFPIFILFLECPDSECDITHDPMKSHITFKNLSGPLSLLRWSITQTTYGREGLPPEIQAKYYGDVKGYWVKSNQSDDQESESSSNEADDEKDDDDDDRDNNGNDNNNNKDVNNNNNSINGEEEEKEDDNLLKINPPEKKRQRRNSFPKSSSDPLLPERLEEYLMGPIYTKSGYSSDPSDSTSPSIPLKKKQDDSFKFTSLNIPSPPRTTTSVVKPILIRPSKDELDNATKRNVDKDNDIKDFPDIIKYASIPMAPHSINKSDLIGIRVLSQIDNKYIIASTTLGRVYAFDQHAVHERIRLERLEDVVLGRNKESRGLGQKLGSWRWEVSEEDCSRITKYLPHIISWGFDITMERSQAEKPVVVCYKVPVVVKTPLNLSDLIEFARVLEAACGAELTVPPAVRRLLALRACRSAIKFGTSLSLDECSELMRLLSECRTPFQCAQ